MTNPFIKALEHSRKKKAFLAKNPDLVKSAYPLPEESIATPEDNSTLNNKDNQVADFVMNKSDDKPDLPKPKPKKLTGLAKALKKAKEKESVKISKNKDILFGTGITKRKAERSEKKLNIAPPKDKKKSVFSKMLSGTAKDIVEAEKTESIKKGVNFLKTKDEHLEYISKTIETEPEISRSDIEIKTYEEKDIKYDEYQQSALNGIQKERLSCLIGAAGTGKTTVEKGIVKIIENQVKQIDLNKHLFKSDDKEYNTENYRPAIAFCAYTGRAAQQMKKALPQEYHSQVDTIHATLGFYPVWEPVFDDEKKEYVDRMRFIPTYDEYNKLPYKILIMDESGMTPIPLWNQVLAALPEDCKIILIGDINQLPPVQGRSVLAFAMIKWPTFKLEKIHRQAADNPIIANAHNILNGLYPQPNKKHFAMELINNGSIKAFNQAVKIIKFLSEKDVFDYTKDAIIVPQNEGNLGQVNFNENLVLYFNKKKETEEGTILNPRYNIKTGAGVKHFAAGDKVMLLSNDRKRGLTNGMIGYIIEIKANGRYKDVAKFSGDEKNLTLDFSDFNGPLEHLHSTEEHAKEEKEKTERQASHITYVKFEGAVKDEIVEFSTAGQYRSLSHAYAFTCHKSQGGEYRNVIIVCHSTNARMLYREWLYTAVTRAQEKVILLYNERGLAAAKNNQRIKGNTIAQKAQKMIELMDKSDLEEPILPKPKRIEL